MGSHCGGWRLGAIPSWATINKNPKKNSKNNPKRQNKLAGYKFNGIKN